MRLFAPSSLKVGCLLCLLAGGVFVFSGQVVSGFFRALDDRVTDAMFRLRGPLVPSGDVVVVDIDEASLRELGQWPWSRSTMAELLRRIDAGGARVIGLDIVFAEPDRTSPKRFLPLFAERFGLAVADVPADFDHDAVLAAAVADTPTVLGYFFELGAALSAAAVDVPFPAFTVALAGLTADQVAVLGEVPIADRPIPNLAVIAADSLSEGFMNAGLGASGLVRRAPLLIRYADVLYPSLAVELVREGRGTGITLNIGSQGLAGLEFGGRLIPTDVGGRMAVNYRGPAHTYPYISAADVLAGRTAGEPFRGKYVLVGTSSWGLRDLRATPFSNTIAGVEIQATIVDNLLCGDALRHDTWTEAAVVVLLVVFGGILLTVFLCRSGALTGLAVTVGLLTVLVVGNYYVFFRNGVVIGIAFPVAALVVVFAAVMSFNYFYEGRAKRFIRNAFAHYVPPGVVAELVRDPARLGLEGEERELTVMFSDIRGFTEIAEALSPAQMRTLLTEYLTAMTDVIMAHGGTVDKFVGDAIMAIWGAPIELPEPADHAILAALGMLEKLSGLRADWAQRGFPPVAIGIGINTGVMAVGNMGSSTRFDYTVIGDNVNVASRLEGLNKLYGTSTLVTAATRQAAVGEFLFRSVDIVRVKGKRHPVRIFEPLVRGGGTRRCGKRWPRSTKG